MTTPLDVTQPSHSKFLAIALISLAAVFGALYVFVLNTIFSHTGNVLDLYVPSRAGADTFVLDSGEFTLMHWIAFAVIVAEAFMAGVFFKQNKPQIGYIVITGMTVLASLYTAVVFGNVLNDEWGSTASILGVIGVILVGFGISLAIVMKFVVKRLTQK